MCVMGQDHPSTLGVLTPVIAENNVQFTRFAETRLAGSSPSGIAVYIKGMKGLNLLEKRKKKKKEKGSWLSFN